MKQLLKLLVCISLTGLIASALAFVEKNPRLDAYHIVSQLGEIAIVLGNDYTLNLTSHQRNRVTNIVSKISKTRTINFDLIAAVMKERKVDDKTNYSTAFFIFLSYFVEPTKVTSVKRLPTIKHYEISFLLRRETSKEKSSDWWPWDYKGAKKTFSWWIYPAFIADVGSSYLLWRDLKEEGIQSYLKVDRCPTSPKTVKASHFVGEAVLGHSLRPLQR